MANFDTPALTLSQSDNFSASVVDDAFDDLASWSMGIGDYQSGHGNIKNDRMVPARKIRSGTLSKVWLSNYTGYNTYILWNKGNTGGAYAAAGNSPVISLYDGGNYDVPGASVNFYLREEVAAKNLIMQSSVHFWKAREGTWFEQTMNKVTAATFEIKLNGYLDGSFINPVPGSPDAVFKYQIAPTASTTKNSFTRRGFDLDFWCVNATALSKGLHTFKVKMNFAITKSTSSDPNDKWLYNHIKGGPPKTSVTAIYK